MPGSGCLVFFVKQGWLANYLFCIYHLTASTIPILLAPVLFIMLGISEQVVFKIIPLRNSLYFKVWVLSITYIQIDGSKLEQLKQKVACIKTIISYEEAGIASHAFCHASSYRHLRNACISSPAYKGLLTYLSSLNKTVLFQLKDCKQLKLQMVYIESNFDRHFRK